VDRVGEDLVENGPPERVLGSTTASRPGAAVRDASAATERCRPISGDHSWMDDED
jgi:hypothetical protein